MLSDVTDSSHLRRKTLRSQRRLRIIQATWRFCVLISLLSGLAWVLARPDWLIRSENQILIEGNQLVSTQTIRQMVKMSYPQTLWTFPSQILKDQLQQEPPLAKVELTRSLFPPQMIVKVAEREPVAIAESEGQKGFIDQQGVFIPHAFYGDPTDQRLQLPLTVLGYRASYQTDWPIIYSVLQKSSIQVKVLDWRNPNNLILQTELGSVHFGAYTSDFPQQLSLLAQMTRLPEQIPQDSLMYIDLSNLAQPTVQVKPQSKEPDSSQDTDESEN